MEEIISALNKVFDSRVRLCIMSILMANERVDYNTFKKTLSLTDGNLASHMKALERHEYIEVHKKFIGRKPNTTYTLSNKGRSDFLAHIQILQRLVDLNQSNSSKLSSDIPPASV